MMQRISFNFSKLSPSQVQLRSISQSTTRFNAKDFYGVLGLASNATHADIKDAYYKLSMKYHPDKNKGSAEAAEQFRQVSDAYEVLGNVRTRKLYDRGVLLDVTQGNYDQKPFKDEPKSQSSRGFYEPLSPETKQKFYEAYTRQTRSRVTFPSDQMKFSYDFDAWTRAHYSETFNLSQENKSSSRPRTYKRGLYVEGKAFLALVPVIMFGGGVLLGIYDPFWFYFEGVNFFARSKKMELKDV